MHKALGTRHRLPFDILYEDDDILVIDKPAGLLTTHTQLTGRAARERQFTAENLLTDYVRKGQWKSSKRVYLVHRLDRETSGVMMFAKRERVADWYRNNWNRVTEKTYLAKVDPPMTEREGVFESCLVEDPRTLSVHSAPTGRRARTEWRVRDSGEVEIHLKSGRKHQIRVHFSEAGHPVVGDARYGGRPADRLYLHALELKVQLPGGEWKTFSSQAPERAHPPPVGADVLGGPLK